MHGDGDRDESEGKGEDADVGLADGELRIEPSRSDVRAKQGGISPHKQRGQPRDFQDETTPHPTYGSPQQWNGQDDIDGTDSFGHVALQSTFAAMNVAGRIRKARAEDIPKTYALIRELAEYERALDEVNMDVATLLEDGFGPNPAYGLIVLEPADRDEVVGIALHYEKYSTWNGRCLFLEDLVVTASERGKGYGKQLLAACAAEAVERGCAYMQWQVLDWNTPAIDFYKSLGADVSSDWLNGRLEGTALKSLAVGS